FMISVAWAQPPRCWTNAPGVTECGNRPPPGVQAREVRTPKPPTDEQAEDNGDPELSALDDPTANLDPETRQRLLIRQRQCELAREVLRTYETADELFDTNEAGERVTLTSEQRADVITEA